MPESRTLVTPAARFRGIVAQHAGRPAVSDASALLSYAALDRASDAVAQGLHARLGVERAHIGILLPNDGRALIAVLGVLKTPYVYVPLDPSWPAPHLQALLDDCGAHAILTDAAGAQRLRGIYMGLVLDITALQGEHTHAPHTDLPSPDPRDIACVYYSSGSTGKPKGILLTHASLVIDAEHYMRIARITEHDRLAWLAPLAFGASKLPVFGGLLSGACVYPFSVNDRGVRALASWLVDERISVYSSTSTLFRKLAEVLPDAALPDLRVVKLGGEPVLRSDALLFERKLHAGCELWNGLGITEVSGNVCYYRHERGKHIDTPTLPLGRAVPGVQIEIVDDDRTALPAGSQGEIVARALHVSPGYLNQPALSLERFSADTFFTGDIGRLTEEGCLIGAGRKDTALKIRGHHVNTAEVDDALRMWSGVSEAVTVGRDIAGAFKLVAFVTVRADAGLDTQALRRDLETRLPRYMVPSRIVVLPTLPTLPNGKLDRGALAAQPLPAPQAGKVAPRSPLELQLVTLWQATLGLPRVGVTDDFFELGGDSLDAARIFAELERVLGLTLPLTELLQHPTIEQLARRLRADHSQARNPDVVALNTADGSVPLFCIPGAGADVFVFRELAEALGPTQTLYVLRHERVTATGVVQNRTVEAMAEHVLRALRRMQPTGPYYLVGSSFGGVIAYELARKLRASGEAVALCALLDTFGKGYPKPKRLVPPMRWPQALLRAGMPAGMRETQYLGTSPRAFVWERWPRVAARLALAAPTGGRVPRVIDPFIYAQALCFAARRQYAFPPCDVPVVLFRVQEQLPADLYEPREDLGWAEVCAGRLQIEVVPGNHATFKHHPHVQHLAEKLRTRISSGRGVAVEPSRVPPSAASRRASG